MNGLRRVYGGHGRHRCGRLRCGRLRCDRSRQHGAGLIEVAVATLVLSIGVLGLVGLQLAAGRAGHEGLQRTVAAQLASDLIERMRANAGALQAYASSGLGAGSGTALPRPAALCRLTRCTPLQLALADLYQWQQALNGANSSTPAGESVGGLVRPVGCVEIQPGAMVTVAIAWEGRTRQSAPGAGRGCGSGRFGPGDEQRQLLWMSSVVGAP